MTDGSRERRIAIVDLLVLVVVVLALSLVSQSVSREKISFSLDRARLTIATAVRIVDAKDPPLLFLLLLFPLPRSRQRESRRDLSLTSYRYLCTRPLSPNTHYTQRPSGYHHHHYRRRRRLPRPPRRRLDVAAPSSSLLTSSSLQASTWSETDGEREKRGETIANTCDNSTARAATMAMSGEKWRRLSSARTSVSLCRALFVPSFSDRTNQESLLRTRALCDVSRVILGRYRTCRV